MNTRKSQSRKALTPSEPLAKRYGSDVMVDAIKALDLKYVSMNPGSSFRGLHDSLVNYGGNDPELIECTHEKIAVQIAHGYAKVTGKAMGVVVHDIVGLLHSTLGVYYAHIDRSPVVIFGGAGPMDNSIRRPHIDWIHTANIQGNAIRDYTKWDDQPSSVEAATESIARAYRIAMEEPRGPVYIALDAGLQEDEVPDDLSVFDTSRIPQPSTIGPDPVAIEQLAQLLADAERPVMVTGYAGRVHGMFDRLVELAELVGIGVIDTHSRLNFPNRHPLNVTGSTAISEADLVLFLDCKDTGKATTTVDERTRKATSLISPDAKVVELGFNDIGISSWSHDFSVLQQSDLSITADVAVAVPLLIEACRVAQEAQGTAFDARQAWRERLGDLHTSVWNGWQEKSAEVWDMVPVSTARLAGEVWAAIQDYDWVLTAGAANEWAYRLWDFDKGYRHAGDTLGTATQFGISLGVALAHRDLDDKRLVVDIQPDGDLMFDLGALWTAAYHKIPMLVVMFNNRAYYNDWAHQEHMADLRGTPRENAFLGMAISDPAPDFANIARSLGWYASGPILNPVDIQAAIKKAAEVVSTTGQPALVDIVCQPK